MIEPDAARFFDGGQQDEVFSFLEMTMTIRWCAVFGVFATLSLTHGALAESASLDPLSQARTNEPSTSPPLKVIAGKPKANTSSKLIAGKSKAHPSEKAMAGKPKASPSPKMVAGTSRPRPASKALAGKPAAAAAATPSVANANAALVTKPHRIVIQVDQNDPAVMNLALNNATNVIDYYRAKQQDVQVDLVTYGPGLHMLRDDTSPVKDRIKQLKDYAFPSTVQFSACTNTKDNMEKKEGKPVSVVSDAVLVPSGVVHVMELQEQGWSYLRP
jgi:intracellular sulfur oxidation DsrE/DsrF family protein